MADPMDDPIRIMGDGWELASFQGLSSSPKGHEVAAFASHAPWGCRLALRHPGAGAGGIAQHPAGGWRFSEPGHADAHLHGRRLADLAGVSVAGGRWLGLPYPAGH